MQFTKLASSMVVAGAAVAYGCAVDVDDAESLEEKREYLGAMNVYLGSFHGHSKASDGDNPPRDVFTWARNSGAFDFYILSDHAELLSSSEWNTNASLANEFNDEGTFVTMRAMEYSNPFGGHANVFETSGKKGWFFTSHSSFYDWVDENGGIAQFNHPGDHGSFDNYAYNARAADNFTMMETANGGDRNASGKFIGYYHTALAKGWKLAPVGNLDNHNLSDSGVRTGVLATSLSRAGIVDAMKKRRVFSSDDPYVEVRFSLGDRWMGEVVSGGAGTYTFDLDVLSDENVVRLDLVVKGVIVSSTAPNAMHASWRPTLAVSADTYAYARVTEADGHVALSAPIWLDVP